MTQDDSATAAQRTYLSFLAAGRTPEMTEAARRLDKQSHATLKALRSKLLNNECFDCTQSMPGWAALPHGVFVCIDCAQVHRHLGRHISQVKAVNTGTYLWFAPEVALMEKVGNAKAARARGVQPTTQAVARQHRGTAPRLLQTQVLRRSAASLGRGRCFLLDGICDRLEGGHCQGRSGGAP